MNINISTCIKAMMSKFKLNVETNKAIDKASPNNDNGKIRSIRKHERKLLFFPTYLRVLYSASVDESATKFNTEPFNLSNQALGACLSLLKHKT